jgi:phosphoribosylamine--glycine ligase
MDRLRGRAYHHRPDESQRLDIIRGVAEIKILVIGGGGREHTLVWKLAQSPKVKEIYAAPGNAGTAMIAHNLDIKPDDIEALAKTASEKNIDLTVVGPEAPLAKGIANQFLIRGLQIFGPTSQATEIESSKVFAKELMQKYKIPCAKSASFSDYNKALDYVKQQPPPIVVKADGLAAGKGVIIAESTAEALDALALIMEEKAFGAAGDRVIIEEYLTGREMSTFAFTDGNTVIPMTAACDYKPAYDGNRGPNTGGMGSYSPPPFLTPALAKTVREKIMEPAVGAMHDEGRVYRGVLYGGLMISNSNPKVLEFNARFGDPEAQVTLPLLQTDLVDIMLAVNDNKLGNLKVEWSQDACVGVVMASGGYPASYKTGFPISGLDDLDKDIVVFHAGTRLEGKRIVTSGGRVLAVVGRGKTIAEAREKVYNNTSRIKFEGCHYRKDIALLKEGS